MLCRRLIPSTTTVLSVLMFQPSAQKASERKQPKQTNAFMLDTVQGFSHFRYPLNLGQIVLCDGSESQSGTISSDRNLTVRNVELRDWHLRSSDASISSPHLGSDKCNHAKFLLNQCSRITDKTQPVSWRDTVGNVCVLCNSLSQQHHSLNHSDSTHSLAISKKDDALEGESLCGTSA